MAIRGLKQQNLETSLSWTIGDAPKIWRLRNLPLHSLSHKRTRINPSMVSWKKLRGTSFKVSVQRAVPRQWSRLTRGIRLIVYGRHSSALMFQELWKQGRESRILPCPACIAFEYIYPGCQQLLAAGTSIWPSAVLCRSLAGTVLTALWSSFFHQNR